MQSSKVLSILFCVIIWQLLALVINSELFPSFVDIVKNLSEQILHKDLIFHLLITLKRVFISLQVSCSCSVFSRAWALGRPSLPLVIGSRVRIAAVPARCGMCRTTLVAAWQRPSLVPPWRSSVRNTGKWRTTSCRLQLRSSALFACLSS